MSSDQSSPHNNELVVSDVRSISGVTDLSTDNDNDESASSSPLSSSIEEMEVTIDEDIENDTDLIGTQSVTDNKLDNVALSAESNANASVGKKAKLDLTESKRNANLTEGDQDVNSQAKNVLKSENPIKDPSYISSPPNRISSNELSSSCLKRPCILIFDSLQSVCRSRTATVLRE